MTLRGYDAWKTRTPEDEQEHIPCVRDDSTECDCPRCSADEDRFWDEQGGDRADKPVTEPDRYEDLP